MTPDKLVALRERMRAVEREEEDGLDEVEMALADAYQFAGAISLAMALILDNPEDQFPDETAKEFMGKADELLDDAYEALQIYDRQARRIGTFLVVCVIVGGIAGLIAGYFLW